jgi:hypothetical protein
MRINWQKAGTIAETVIVTLIVLLLLLTGIMQF